jgi:hypothetical protein
MPRSRYGIEEALAEIKRVHQEMQIAPGEHNGGAAGNRRRWRSFAVGFAIGTACFAGAVAFIKFFG